MTGTNCKYKKRLAEVEDESANMIRSLQQQVNTLSSELDRYKSYVNKTNYDSEKVALGAVYKDIENGKLREQVNTLTKVLGKMDDRKHPMLPRSEMARIIKDTLDSLKESPREEQEK